MEGEIYLVGGEVIWVHAVDEGLSVDTPSFVICLPEVVLSDNKRPSKCGALFQKEEMELFILCANMQEMWRNTW